MSKWYVMGLALALCGVSGAQAQMGGRMAAGNSNVAPGSAVDPAKSLDAALSRVEALWTGAAQAMPADKYAFKPTAATFAASQSVKYDGVRTFAEIVTHMIQVNYSVFSAIGGIKPDIDPKTLATVTSKDEIVKAVAATFAFAHKAVANVNTQNAFSSVRGMQTPVSMFAGGIGHAEDEYGQAVEYLRMNGIVPPASETPTRPM